jgi:hypothetical protein
MTRAVLIAFLLLCGTLRASALDCRAYFNARVCGGRKIPRPPLKEAVAIAQCFLDQHKINMSGQILEFVEYQTPFLEYAPSFWELTWTGRRRIVLWVFQDGLCIMPSAYNQAMQPSGSSRTTSLSMIESYSFQASLVLISGGWSCPR